MLLYLYSEAGSFAVLDLHALPLGLTAQKLVFVAFLAAFAVKVPMRPVHNWLPPEPYRSAAYAVRAAPATRIVADGDVVDLGDRHFEVLMPRAVRPAVSPSGKPPPASCSRATSCTTALWSKTPGTPAPAITTPA